MKNTTTNQMNTNISQMAYAWIYIIGSSVYQTITLLT